MPNTASDISGEPPARAKPFVKWAGGKTKLLPDILANIPENFNRYFEPFIGGGAVFFTLKPARGVISDSNAELINVYETVRDAPSELIAHLHTHSTSKEYFYFLRDADREDGYRGWSSVQRASRFIYLNRLCFNGLYRVNSKGHFNVPFGDYKNPVIAQEDVIYACSESLSSIDIKCGSFDEVLADAREGDFVYLDPPYQPVSKTASFTGYTKEGFDIGLQKLLATTCKALDERGVKFLLSNSYTDFVLGIYREFNIKTVSCARAINSKYDKRGKVMEVLISNYQTS